MTTSNDELKVLVVDDNPVNARLLERMVEKAGYKPAVVFSGEECLEYCSHSKPDIILLDVMMPGIDGIQTCRQVRELYPKAQLPVIMVTTRISGADISAGFQAGANDYVTKPVDRYILLARMDNALQSIRSQQDLLIAQRKTQRALLLQHAMGDAMPHAIFVHDEDGEIVYQNQSLFLMSLGQEYSYVDELFEDFADGGFRKLFSAERVIDLQRGVADVDEDVTVRIDDRRRVFSIASRPIDTSEGEKFRLWVVKDITKERTLERRVQQTVRMKTVGLFASGVAHNFNNIFGGLLGAAEILKRSADRPERIARCLKIFDEALSSGMTLTKKMYVGKSLFETGTDSQSIEPESASNILLAIWRDYESRASERQISFSVDKELSQANLQLPLEALRVIFGNLFENAIDAMEVSGGEVRCSLDPDSDSSDKLVILVSDSGHGMDSETLTRATEPFFSTRNLDSTNNVSIEGKGLGLWNVYSMVRLLEGELFLKSRTRVEGESGELVTSVAVELPCRWSSTTAEVSANL